MKKEQSNLRGQINKAMKNSHQDEQDLPVSSAQADGDSEQERTQPLEGNEKAEAKRLNKPLIAMGSAAILVAIVALIFSGNSSVDTTESAKNALVNRVSTSVSAGTVLLSADEPLEAQDFTITHQSSQDNTDIYVWDYAAEDGDYVQVLVDGAPVTDPFMIRHKPRVVNVPAVGVVQIKGIRDGGGGITYAVNYSVTKQSYFNGTPEGELNTYTLVKE